MTGKINLLTQKVGDFLQEAQTRQEILEDKIDGLEDKLITSRTHGAEENGEPGWRVGETQPLNSKLKTPRTNTKTVGTFPILENGGKLCTRTAPFVI